MNTPIYISDNATEQEMMDIRDEQREMQYDARLSWDTKIDGQTYNCRYGSMRDAVDALRPYAASKGIIERWSEELVMYFSVTSPGAQVIAWRTGTDDTVIKTAVVSAYSSHGMQ